MQKSVVVIVILKSHILQPVTYKKSWHKTTWIIQGRYYFRVNELSDKPPLDKTRVKVRNTTMAKVARSTDKRTSSNNGTRSACYWTIIPGSHCQSFPYQPLHITAPTTPLTGPTTTYKTPLTPLRSLRERVGVVIISWRRPICQPRVLIDFKRYWVSLTT